MRLLVFALLLALAPQTYAGVYKCTTNGQTTYSDKPCPGAEQREIEHMDNKPPFSSASQSSKSKGRERKKLDEPATETLIQSCLEKWRPLLKDPRSPYVVGAQIDEVRNLERPDVPPWKEVVMDVRAKNSFGAYVPEVFVCGVGEDSMADVKTTEVNQAMYRLGIKFGLDDKYVK